MLLQFSSVLCQIFFPLCWLDCSQQHSTIWNISHLKNFFLKPTLKLQYHYSALPCPKKFLYLLSLLHTHSLLHRPQSEFNPNHSTKTLLVPVTVDLCLESLKVSSQFLFHSFYHQQLASVGHSLSLEQRPRHMSIVDLPQVGYSHEPKQKKCLPCHLFIILDILSAFLDAALSLLWEESPVWTAWNGSCTLWAVVGSANGGPWTRDQKEGREQRQVFLFLALSLRDCLTGCPSKFLSGRPLCSSFLPAWMKTSLSSSDLGEQHLICYYPCEFLYTYSFVNSPFINKSSTNIYTSNHYFLLRLSLMHFPGRT